MDGGNQGCAYGCGVPHDGPGEGDGRQRRRLVDAFLQPAQHQPHQVAECFALTLQHGGSDGIVLLGATENKRRERREVGRGQCVRETDQVIDGVQLPELQDGIEQQRGAAFVPGQEERPQGFQANAVS